MPPLTNVTCVSDIVNVNTTNDGIYDKYTTGNTVPNGKNVFKYVPIDLKYENILKLFNNKEGLTEKRV